VPQAGSAEQRAAFDQEMELAEACAINFRSVANQARYVLTRSGGKAPDRAVAENALRSEIDLAKRLYMLQIDDSRLGFEASNQYVYIPLDLVEKVLNARYLLDHNP
jgi:hypothetical protein